MSPEVAAALWAVGGSIATLVITNLFNAKQINRQMEFQREERSFQIKQALISNSYTHRAEAYTKLSSVLYEFDSYLRSFIDSGNEYYDKSNPEHFSPLEYRTKIWDCFTIQSLWLSQDAQNAYYQFFVRCDTGVSLASNLPDDVSSKGVREFCIDMTVEIRNIRNVMKEDLGITYADDFKSGKQQKNKPLKEACAARED